MNENTPHDKYLRTNYIKSSGQPCIHVIQGHCGGQMPIQSITGLTQTDNKHPPTVNFIFICFFFLREGSYIVTT